MRVLPSVITLLFLVLVVNTVMVWISDIKENKEVKVLTPMATIPVEIIEEKEIVGEGLEGFTYVQQSNTSKYKDLWNALGDKGYTNDQAIALIGTTSTEGSIYSVQGDVPDFDDSMTATNITELKSQYASKGGQYAEWADQIFGSNSGGGLGVGIAQWDANRRYSMLSYNSGYPIVSIKHQVSYLDKELDETRESTSIRPGGKTSDLHGLAEKQMSDFLENNVQALSIEQVGETYNFDEATNSYAVDGNPRNPHNEEIPRDLIYTKTLANIIVLKDKFIRPGVPAVGLAVIRANKIYKELFGQEAKLP